MTFSKPVTGGDSAANYELQSLGPDGLLDTDNDAIIPLSASYSGTTAVLGFAPLPNGVYRLTVRGAITDISGEQFDGDADGTPGGDWTTNFVALPSDNVFHSLPSYPSGGNDAVLVGNGGPQRRWATQLGRRQPE